MENKICVRCGYSDSRLPLCNKCREELREFNALAEYLNSFKGSKEDLLWIIGSEISNRESSIISHVKVVINPASGTIELVPIEPNGYIIKGKPWLREKYEHINGTIGEIVKLRRAQGIVHAHYEIA